MCNIKLRHIVEISHASIKQYSRLKFNLKLTCDAIKTEGIHLAFNCIIIPKENFIVYYYVNLFESYFVYDRVYCFVVLLKTPVDRIIR